MARFAIGEEVKVHLPRGKSKRGVMGISVMFATSQEAKFDGATGVVTDINPRGPLGIPLYLVDFSGHDNSRIGIPWQAQWMREEWIVGTRQKEPVLQPRDDEAPAGMGRTARPGQSS
ncbi:MAG: hypothetical protein M3457_22545 [Chloroflexota bacterium]|nr:hypothetical protein [Chloroflexota bacterium]